MSVGVWIVILLGSQVFGWAAREHLHRGLKKAARGLAGAFRVAATWCRGAAKDLTERNNEVLVATGLADSRKRIDRELRKLDSSLPKDLGEYRRVQRELSDVVNDITSDYQQCGQSPPDAPGWSEAVAAAKQLPDMSDKGSARVLEELKRAAIDGEKKALTEYRKATGQRHKILGKIAPRMKSVQGLLDDVGSVMEKVAQSTESLDEHIAQYATIQKDPATSVRTLGRSAVNLFVVSLIVMAVAIGGGLINFQLIAMPMAELVPSTAQVSGMPVSNIAALVVVLLEVTAGVFLMEMLGVTNLFPRMQTLPTSRRRLILGVAVGALLVLSCVEASLAILREHIVDAENALNVALAGEAAQAVETATASRIPMVGQAVLGFVLPWVLAMAAVPLEMLIATGSVVLVSVLSLLLAGLGVLMRVTGRVLRYLLEVVRYAFDVYIAVPLMIERVLVSRGGAPAEVLESAHGLSATGETEVRS